MQELYCDSEGNPSGMMMDGSEHRHYACSKPIAADRSGRRPRWSLLRPCRQWTLWILLAGCLPLHLHAEYNKNSEIAPKEKTLEDGGIRMEVGRTIRLTPAPVSAFHPWLKAIRLDNGDLIFNCPLSWGGWRDYAVSPREEGDDCCLRSQDNGETWQKALSQTSEDGGKTWRLRPTAVQRAVRLKDGSLIADGGRNLCMSLTPTADKRMIYKRVEPMSLGYAPTMTQLADGRILCAAQQGWKGQVVNGVKLEDGYYIDFLISADLGVHWQAAGRLSFLTFGDDLREGFEGYGEPFFLKAANGDLLLFLRTTRHSGTGLKVGPKYPPVKVVRSTDDGKTWSKPIEVHPTGVMPTATLLDNGIIVAFTGRGGNRVAASRDNGLTWSCHLNIMSTDQSPNFSGHNAVVPAGPSRALLIYTHNHPHPDNKPDCPPDNKYNAELIGTFVTFKPADPVKSGAH